MPALTADQQQAMIADELGQGGDPTFLARVETWWTFFADKATLHHRLQYLYVKRQAVTFLLGRVWADVDYSEEDVNEDLDQWTRHLTGLKELLDAEILDLEQRIRSASQGPKTGLIAATSPYAPIYTSDPDPNHPVYRGVPRYRARTARR